VNCTRSHPPIGPDQPLLYQIEYTPSVRTLKAVASQTGGVFHLSVLTSMQTTQFQLPSAFLNRRRLVQISARPTREIVSCHTQQGPFMKRASTLEHTPACTTRRALVGLIVIASAQVLFTTTAMASPHGSSRCATDQHDETAIRCSVRPHHTPPAQPSASPRTDLTPNAASSLTPNVSPNVASFNVSPSIPVGSPTEDKSRSITTERRR
jgi:hypothetical protein